MFLTPILTTSLLLLASVAQEPASEPELRRLAVAFASSPDRFETAWADAEGAERVLLLQALARAHPHSDVLAAACVRALSDADPLVQGQALLSARDAGADPALTAALAARIAPGPADPFFARAVEAAFDRGELPGNDGAAWNALDAATQEQASTVLARFVESRGVPRRGLGATLEHVPAARAPLLLALAGKGALSPQAAAFVATLDDDPATPFDHLVRRIVLLDSGVQDAGMVQDLLVAHLAKAVADPDRANELRWAVRRHAHLMTPTHLADALDTWTPERGMAEDDLFTLLLKLPVDLTYERLLAEVLDEDAKAKTRSRAALRLLRGSGERATYDLKILLEGKQPQELYNALLAGMKPYADASLLPVLRTRIERLEHEGATLACEILVAHCEHAERMEWMQKLMRLRPAQRKRVAREAWYADPHPEILTTFWEWTRVNDSDVQDLARASLQIALDEEALAFGYGRRLQKETDPAVRGHLVQALRMLRSDAALAVFTEWLATPEGRGHPDSERFAALVVGEDGAKEMFRSWWAESDGLSATQLDLAATALASENDAARKRLRERFESIEMRNHHLVMQSLIEGSTASEWEWWAGLVGDREADRNQRRIAAMCLGKSLPGSARQVERLLGQLELDIGNGASSDVAFSSLLAFSIQHGSAEFRDWLVTLGRELEATVGPQDGGLRQARLQAMTESPVPAETGLLLEEVLEGLGDGTAPLQAAEREPDVVRLRPFHGRYAMAVLALAAHDDADADRALAEAIQAGGPWHGDRLWLIPAVAEETLPQASAAARHRLAITEPARSRRRADANANELQLPLASWLKIDEILAVYDGRLASEDYGADTDATLEVFRGRWAEDRRFHNYAGWFALARGDLGAAGSAFQAGRRRSGTLPFTTLEPRLGWAVINELSVPGKGHLARFLQEEEQAIQLLRVRLATRQNEALGELLGLAEEIVAEATAETGQPE